MIVDAKNAVLGRLASKVAKEILNGEKVIIVNAEKVIITGDPKMILKKYFEKRKRGDPFKGPFFPRYPDKILRRVIRGMVPRRKERGMKAMKRLKVHIGCPEDCKDAKPVSKTLDKITCKYVTLGKLCKQMGAKI